MSTSTRPRDVQRQRVYNAERDVARGLALPTVGELQAYTDHVLGSAWYADTFQRRPHVTVLDGRGRRRACALRVADGYHVKMPRHARYERALLHELAHCTPDGHGHGRGFARAYLLLVWRFMGVEPFEQLLDSFRAHRVDWEGSVL